MKKSAILLILGISLVSSNVFAQQTESSGVTAQNQMNDQADVEITRQIRRRVVDDPSLSTDAQNVKIISRDGNVVLKGPVRSKTEKDTIGRKAQSTNGVKSVQNQLEVKSSKG